MFLRILILKFKDAPLVSVDYMRVQIFVITLMIPSIRHMHMPVKEKFRMVFLYQPLKRPESLMRQIPSVIKLIGRRMRHQYIEAPPTEQFKAQLRNSLFHLPFSILMRPLLIAHGTAEPQNADSFVDKNLILNADAPFRCDSLVFLIMVPMYIQYRNMGKCCQKRKVLRI